ncbi:MAG: 3-methylornithine--L-lysine ligase PylC [Deltaproteobacteria bacterium]|nr:3-methylornithine--L-lysine ligase PylC [Deltaproteobacteria bacterium]
MLIAVVGGKLQGVEAVYLARKAGWKTLVIDKNPGAPAAGLCDRFLEFKFSFDQPVPKDCPKIDFILPAIEDDDVLALVNIWAKEQNIPLAFDKDAYRISSSKLKSDAFFKKMNLPAPRSWPDCGYPVVVKPDKASGSRGVEVFKDASAFFSRFPNRNMLQNMVVQEYIKGPLYSVEVVGSPGRYRVLQITDLSMDKAYDCERVSAPAKLLLNQITRFEKMAFSIAGNIHLKGIMDVEAVLNKDQLKLLEIDARFPSQTPIAVFWSTGINMVELLGRLVLNGKILDDEPGYERSVVVEHVLVSGSGLEVSGEHIMTQHGPLTIQPDFFGANEAITSYTPGAEKWVATLIFSGRSDADVASRILNCHEKILKFYNPVLQEQNF